MANADSSSSTPLPPAANNRNNRRRSSVHWASQTGDTVALRGFLSEGGPQAKDLVEESDGGLNGDRPIHLAARSGHATVIQDLLKFGANINALNDSGDTPLIVACIEKQYHIVRFLLTQPNVNIQARGSLGRTALHRACENKTPQCADELLKVASALVHLDMTDVKMNTCLHLAASSGNYEIVDLLLVLGLSHAIDWQNTDGWTALHLASFGGHYHVVKYLLEKGANAMAKGYHDRTPLHKAVEGDQEDIVEFFLNNYCGDDAEKRSQMMEARETELGGTALHIGAMFGSTNSVATLLIKGVQREARTLQYGYSAAQVAAMRGNPGVIDILAEHRCDLQYRGPTGKAAVHLAAQFGHANALSSLHKQKAYLDARDDISGATPLHYACYFGRLNCVKFLVNSGCDKSAKDLAGDAPIHYATLGNQPQVLSFLMSRGTETGSKDTRIGRTALHDAVAKDYVECANVLLGRANIEAQDDENLATPLHLAAWFNRTELAELLLRRRVNSAAKDRHIYCPIHWAAIRGNREIIRILLRHGANVNLKGGTYGRTALHMAAQWGHEDCAELLIANSADLEVRDDRRKATALHLAAQFSQANIVHLLIDAGAKLELRDELGLNALHVAASCGAGQSLASGQDVISVNSGRDKNNDNNNELNSSMGRSSSRAGSSFSQRSSSSSSSSSASSAERRKLNAIPQLQIIKMLLEKRSKLLNSLTAKWERTPLMCAALNGQLAAAELLVQSGADATLKDKIGKTALRLAFDANHYDVVKMFVRNGIKN